MRLSFAQEQGSSSASGITLNASVHQAAQTLIDRHKSGMPVYIEAFDVPHRALLLVAAQLEDLGVSHSLAENFIGALKDYVVAKGGDFARTANAKPIFISAEVAERKPDFRFEDGITELAAIDGKAAKVQGVGQVEVQATISGTSMTSNRANIDKMFEGVRGSKLWVRFEAPTKKDLDGLLAQQDLTAIAVVQGIASTVTAIEAAAAVQSIDAQSGTALPAPIQEAIKKIIQLKAIAETPATLQSAQKIQEIVGDIIKKTEAYALPRAAQADVSPAVVKPISQDTPQISSHTPQAAQKTEETAKEKAREIEVNDLPQAAQVDASPVVAKAILQSVLQISSSHMIQGSPVQAQLENILRQVSTQTVVRNLSAAVITAPRAAVPVINNLIRELSSSSAPDLARHAPAIRQLLAQNNIPIALKNSLVEAVKNIVQAAPLRPGVTPAATVAAVRAILAAAPASAATAVASILQKAPANVPVSVIKAVASAILAKASTGLAATKPAAQTVVTKSAAVSKTSSAVVAKPAAQSRASSTTVVKPQASPARQPVSQQTTTKRAQPVAKATEAVPKVAAVRLAIPQVFTKPQIIKNQTPPAHVVLRSRNPEVMADKFKVQGKSARIETTTAAKGAAIEVAPAAPHHAEAPVVMVAHKAVPVRHVSESHVHLPSGDHAPIHPKSFIEGFKESAKNEVPKESLKVETYNPAVKETPEKGPVEVVSKEDISVSGRSVAYTAEAPNELSKTFNIVCKNCPVGGKCDICPMKNRIDINATVARLTAA